MTWPCSRSIEVAAPREYPRPPRCVAGACLWVFLTGLGGCSSSGVALSSSDRSSVSYADDVLPIFQLRCQGCHRPGGTSGIGLCLPEPRSYGLIVEQPSRQDARWTLIVPGDAVSSLLFLKVSSDKPPVGERMPQVGGALADDEIELIRAWIDSGAAE